MPVRLIGYTMARCLRDVAYRKNNGAENASTPDNRPRHLASPQHGRTTSLPSISIGALDTGRRVAYHIGW